MKRFVAGLFLVFLGALIWYYFSPTQRIPGGVEIDRILVLKSHHQLLAYSHNKLIVIYPVSLGRQAVGPKEWEGDEKTPEGLYTINSKNAGSGWHKNLGISYPNAEDIGRARQMGKASGADIKIHGLKNGQGWIGKFQRWRDWTNGCIGLTNSEVDELFEHTAVGTPIEIDR